MRKKISVAVRAAKLCKSSSLVALAIFAAGETARAADSGAALQTMIASSSSMVSAHSPASNFDLSMVSSGHDTKRLVRMAANDTDAGPNKLLAAKGVKLGDDGKRHYVEGPVVQAKAGSRGPLFEIGALGGGDARAPSLAHVGMYLIF